MSSYLILELMVVDFMCQFFGTFQHLGSARSAMWVTLLQNLQKQDAVDRVMRRYGEK